MTIASIQGDCLEEEEQEKTMGMTAWKTDLVPALTIGAVAGRAAVVITLLWHAAMSKCGVCGQQTRTDVEKQKVLERNDEKVCVRSIGVRSMCTK